MARKTQAQIDFIANTSQYNAGIKEMDLSNKTLRSELKLNAVELKGNADNVDLLSQRQNLLKQESGNTSEKIRLLEKALKEAETTLGKNSKEYYNLNNALINTKTQQAAIQNEIRDTNRKMREQQDYTKDLDVAVDDLGESLQETGKETTTFGDVLKANLAADVIKEGIEQVTQLAIGNFMEMNDSVKDLSSSLGATGEPLTNLRSVLDEVYRAGYGENFQDISVAIKEVSTQMGDMDGDELVNVTKNAIALRDTFDLDYSESIRAVNMLMNQFGLTSDESFNLIVQGAQNGLNKNGDLLDVINEYSVHFKQIGLDADEMFNVLMNGTNAGTFSVDKLGDAVKEFAIRIKDGTADEALTQLGLNVDDVKNRFAQGGEVGKQAFEEINQALFNVSDTNTQFVLGTSMYGTMFEDLGATGVQALSDMDNIFDSNISSMNKIKEIRYDDVITQLETLKRGFEQDISGAVQTFVLPALSGMLDFVTKNKDMIEALAIGLGAGAIVFGTATAAVAIYNGVLDFMTVSATAGTTASTALGGALVFLTQPIGIAVAAVTGLVAAGVLLYKNWDTVKQKASELWQSVTSTFNDIKNSIDEKINGAKELVGNAIDAIVGFFSFNIQWPHIPLPHFDVKPAGWHIGDLLKGKIPSLGINWYAKGGFFRGPTVLSGVGEAGDEYALPLNDRTLTPLANLLSDRLNSMNVQEPEYTLYLTMPIHVAEFGIVDKVSKKIALNARRLGKT